MASEKSAMNEIKFDDYNVTRKGISHLGDRFGSKDLCRKYAYCKTNPCYNYYKDVSSNTKKIGMHAKNSVSLTIQYNNNNNKKKHQNRISTTKVFRQMKKRSIPPNILFFESPLPLQPFISVGQSAAVTPKAVLPRTIDYGDRMEADAFYTLCQYNRAFYKEIPVLRPWDYTFFSCGRPMFEQKNLTEQAKIRQEVPYKHPHVLPVTLCRTFGYKDSLGQHRYVPNIFQGVETSFIS